MQCALLVADSIDWIAHDLRSTRKALPVLLCTSPRHPPACMCSSMRYKGDLVRVGLQRA